MKKRNSGHAQRSTGTAAGVPRARARGFARNCQDANDWAAARARRVAILCTFDPPSPLEIGRLGGRHAATGPSGSLPRQIERFRSLTPVCR